MSSNALPAGTVTHWTVNHGMSGYLPMSDDNIAWRSWSDAREALIADMRDYADTDDDIAWDQLSTVPASDYPTLEDGSPDYGDDAPTMLATVNAMITDGDVAPIYGEEWTGVISDNDDRNIYFALQRHDSSECEDSCELADDDDVPHTLTFHSTIVGEEGPVTMTVRPEDLTSED